MKQNYKFTGNWVTPAKYRQNLLTSEGYLTDYAKSLMKELKVYNLEDLLNALPGYFSRGMEHGEAKQSHVYAEPGGNAEIGNR